MTIAADLARLPNHRSLACLYAELYGVMDLAGQRISALCRDGRWADELARRHHELSQVIDAAPSTPAARERCSAEVTRVLASAANLPDDAACLVGCAVLQVLGRWLVVSAVEIFDVPLELPDRTSFLLLREAAPPWVVAQDAAGRYRRPAYFSNDIADHLGLVVVPLFLGARRVRPHVVVPPRELARRLVRAGPDLRVGLASPLSFLRPAIRPFPELHGEESGTPFLVGPYRDEDRRTVTEELAALLLEARRQGVHVLCLPELALDGAALDFLRSNLHETQDAGNPILTIAGSVHVQGADGHHRNRCTTLNWRGDVVMEHDKLFSFALNADDVARLYSRDPEDQRPVPGPERIRLGETFPFLVTPLGRMATPICLDFLCQDQLRLERAARPQVLWVPAMSPKVSPFRDQAARSVRLGATVCVVNSLGMMRRAGDADGAAFAAVPGARIKQWSVAHVEGCPSAMVVFKMCHVIDG